VYQCPLCLNEGLECEAVRRLAAAGRGVDATVRGTYLCYRPGRLEFDGVTDVEWTGQGAPPATDASGEIGPDPF
jgi:hypothetical protein